MKRQDFFRWPSFLRQKWLVVGLLTSLLIWSLIGGVLVPSPAAAQQLESRLTQLEFQLRQVRSQISQLEARLSQPGSSAPAPRPAPSTASSPANPDLATQFDNLATLTIELRQQLRALEGRVTQLEERTLR